MKSSCSSKCRFNSLKNVLTANAQCSLIKALIITNTSGGACGIVEVPVMVIVAGNGYGDTSSNPGRDWLHFT